MRLEPAPVAAALAAFAIVVATSPAGTSTARAFEPLEGALTATSACPAKVRIAPGAPADGATLEIGRRYPLLGGNRPGGDHLQIRIAGASPQLRWVEARCGTIETAAATSAQVAPSPELAPFFDDRDGGPADPQPPPPPLSPLDERVLALCGRWGSTPSEAAFRRMLDEPAVAPEIDRIGDRLAWRIDGRPLARPAFAGRLARAWFALGAFEHVFCGEPEAAGIGGLHFRGRYLDLQGQGVAGLSTGGPCTAAEVAFPVLTIGVSYRLPGDTRTRQDCTKSYAYDMDAADILVEATRTLHAGRRAPAMCLTPVAAKGGGQDYLAVTVARRGSLVTFYPDTTPRCDSGAAVTGCLCPS